MESLLKKKYEDALDRFCHAYISKAEYGIIKKSVKGVFQDKSINNRLYKNIIPHQEDKNRDKDKNNVIP